MILVVGPRQRPCEIQSTIGAGGMAGAPTKQATPALRLTLEMPTSGRHLDFVIEPVPLDAKNL